MSTTFVIRGRHSVRVAPSVGVTVMNNRLVMVSVRDEPLRITGVYRQDLSSAGERSANDKLLGKALRHGRRALRLPRGSRVTLALQPQEGHIAVRLDQTHGNHVTVRCRPTLPRLLHDAGFGSAAYDSLPVSLARAALCASLTGVSFHHRSGWQISATTQRLDAEWSAEAVSGSPTEDSVVLRGVQIPKRLEAIVRVGLDAGAIGAALGDVGLGPRTRRVADHAIDLRSTTGVPRPAIA